MQITFRVKTHITKHEYALSVTQNYRKPCRENRTALCFRQIATFESLFRYKRDVIFLLMNELILQRTVQTLR